MLFALLFACSTPEPTAAPTPPPTAAPAPVAPAPAAPAADAVPESPMLPAAYVIVIADMRAREATITSLLAAGKLKDIHPEAKALIDLAVDAPGKAPDAQRALVTLKALDLKEKADTLHDRADAGDAPGATTAFEAVKADIEALARVSG
jgi:hypothetical protein